MLLLAIAMVGAITAIVMLMENPPKGIDMLAALALPLAWVWVFYRIFRSRILWAKQIRKRDAWIDAVHESVLYRVPPLPTAPES